MVDFVVRGEGEVTFRELVRAIENKGSYEQIAGLSYRDGDQICHNSDRPAHRLLGEEIRPPNRSARVLHGYTCLGRQIDVIETSRGCTFDCSFFVCYFCLFKEGKEGAYRFPLSIYGKTSFSDHSPAVINSQPACATKYEREHISLPVCSLSHRFLIVEII